MFFPQPFTFVDATVRAYVNDFGYSGTDFHHPKSIVIKCPFHGDKKHKHLYIFLKTGKWVCFRCGAHGFWEDLLQELNWVETHIPDRILPPSENIKKDELLVLPESVLASYRIVPKLLLDKGFDPMLLIKHQVGFDRINMRIVFPIRSYKGELVGIVGRTIFSDVEPRYMAYTSILKESYPNYNFYKGHHLYNFNNIYSKYYNSSTQPKIIIVEGFKACLWLVQQGWEDTCALMGSNMTKEQANLLSSLTNRFVLFLDNNPAGRSGSKKIVTFLQNYGIVDDVVTPKMTKEQPDDFSKAELKDILDPVLNN